MVSEHPLIEIFKEGLQHLAPGKHQQVHLLHEIKKYVWSRQQTDDQQGNEKFYQNSMWKIWQVWDSQSKDYAHQMGGKSEKNKKNIKNV